MFQEARPLWPAGLADAMNITCGIRAKFQAEPQTPALVRVTASSRYRIYVNGLFCGHGPAAGPHGYYRVDEWDVTPYLGSGSNDVAIETAGYNVNSFYTLDQPSFVQAEVEQSGQIAAATGSAAHPFAVFVLPERMRRVQRYSFQRAFIEAYALTPDTHAWRTSDALPASPAQAEIAEEKRLLPRRVSYPRFDVAAPHAVLATGTFGKSGSPAAPWRDRSISSVGPAFKGFPLEELEVVPTDEIGELAMTGWNREARRYEGQALQLLAGETALLAFGRNSSGFIGMEFTVSAKSRIALTFDEILTEDGDVDHLRLGCANVIYAECEPGTYTLESIEPYTLQYLKVLVLEGDCKVTGCSIREYANPDADRGTFASSDAALNAIFEAARETFRQNAVDVFMDCPSRERAGWLCDSYFTARVEADLTGSSVIERNFFENYALPESFAFLPEGMLPMCYPADHNDGVFIPNWSLWFVLQLEEFRDRGGDEATIASLLPRIEALFQYFEGFRNEFGLLENLESWVFIEWSKANDFIGGINYPTNMLYAAALEAAGRIYGADAYLEEAAYVKQTVREHSFDGAFFVDQAIEDEQGELEILDHRTEVCQYYAAYFGIADAEELPVWFDSLLQDFSPSRDKDAAFVADIGGIHPANAFIGYYLRMELLSRHGATAQLLEEIKAFFGKMAERTGTLWEHNRTQASCNHGFASHVARALYRDALGIKSLNSQRGKLTVAFTDNALASCSGTLPTPDGDIALSWRAEGDTIFYRLSAPSSLTVEIENHSGKSLVKEEEER
ncbi:hypothetical protein GZH47_13555 [Paenibacillus rhizovicinus]|uniref:Alpha-L-rhamnosidase six-hairpin glycosidase domain-containing protein n=1 Tax=Paenibacillus rhizovicinus TaxID=2704463 RepID=A0A6C0NZU6_9BACL|nr:hypothetical protein [Paenibacillus rhizovicinus]QHW31764.1 hypothetical protein GZH47_13555 [Paenibacillus rhizovicinus]